MSRNSGLAIAVGMSLAMVSSITFRPSLAADLTDADKTFMHNAAIAGMTEVKLGKVAEKNSTNAQVKDFAAKMVVDHTKANHALQKVAGEAGVQLPQQCDAKHKALVEKLSKLSGTKFDHDFMNQMVEDHKKVAADLESEESTSAVALKQWCEKTLPTVKEHLKMAESLDISVAKE